MNAVRISQGPWCIAAFSEETGLICSQDFHGIWPSSQWTTKSLAAVLNAPIASAFVAVRENKIHIRKHTLENLPLPQLGLAEIETLDRLVDRYLRIVKAQVSDQFTLQDPSFENKEAKQILLQIDALVLKGYDLSPRLERQLLDFFNGLQRPVPFSFTGYYPADLDTFVPLHELISDEYARSTLGRFREQHKPTSSPEVLAALQQAVGAFAEE
jgi:hypothetical protein